MRASLPRMPFDGRISPPPPSTHRLAAIVVKLDVLWLRHVPHAFASFGCVAQRTALLGLVELRGVGWVGLFCLASSSRTVVLSVVARLIRFVLSGLAPSFSSGARCSTRLPP